MPCTEKQTPNLKLLNGASDRKASVDLMTSLDFTIRIARTDKQPDTLMWSDSKKSVFRRELTILWKKNIEETHERKKDRYESLRADFVENGWTCNVMLLRLGVVGFWDKQSFPSLQK